MRKVGMIAALLAAALLAPQRPAVAKGDQTVVVTAGNEKLTVADIQERLLHVPSFQLKAFGDTPREIRKSFVEKVMIPQMLYAQEARRRKLDRTPEVADRVLGVLRSAMMADLKKQVDAKQQVTDAQIRAYYLQHESRFNTPKRIRIWRILVADKAAAGKIIEQAQGTGGPARWSRIARGQSLDKATSMRDGNLGFVRPDGRTEVPRVRVDPALYAAANTVKNGEVVPKPIKEGDQWAVVWRRGSMPAVTRTAKQEADSIRHVLRRQRMEDTTRQLVARLKSEHVSDVNYKLLQYVNVNSLGDVGVRRRPGLLPRRRPRGGPGPTQTERGLR